MYRNLWHPVSQDAVNGKHNVRWEDYTSFNLPAQIRFGSLLDINNPTNTLADRSLSFVYGPEHQRIKQNVTLTSAGTNSYFAGNTWYLNGLEFVGLLEPLGLTQNRPSVVAPPCRTTRTACGGTPSWNNLA